MFLMISPAALSAQVVPAPVKFASSSTGVNLRSGSYSFSDIDLQIGEGLPNGLTLTRTYNSGAMGSSASITGALSWSSNLDSNVAVTAIFEDPAEEQAPNHQPSYLYTVVVLGQSYAFLNTYRPVPPNHTGGPVGTYVPYGEDTGATLVFSGSAGTGNYVLTEPDGTVATFRSAGSGGRLLRVVRPDGSRLDWSYDSSVNLASVTSNRGWAIYRNSNDRLCAVNIAWRYLGTAAACPVDAQGVSYGFSNGTYLPSSRVLTSVTGADGAVTTYQYAGADHLSCVKQPGQSVCAITNTYFSCQEDPSVGGKQYQLHLSDPVTGQVDAAGKQTTYSYANSGYSNLCPNMSYQTYPSYPDYRLASNTDTIVTETPTNGGNATQYSASVSPDADSVATTDALGRTYGIDIHPLYGVSSQLNPEKDSWVKQFDALGNVVGQTNEPKPNSGATTISSSATFPSSCTNRVLCRRPTSVSDANGNVTSFAYDPTHGGVVTATHPADASGVQAVERYSYVQRSAWLSNAGGGYSPSPYPIWVLADMRTCRTTATIGNGCAGGAGDEVVTSYDYGPNAGPNNLQLRGVAVSAGGAVRRTCYGYDENGNRIWETKPRAGLASCY